RIRARRGNRFSRRAAAHPARAPVPTAAPHRIGASLVQAAPPRRDAQRAAHRTCADPAALARGARFARALTDLPQPGPREGGKQRGSTGIVAAVVRAAVAACAEPTQPTAPVEEPQCARPGGKFTLPAVTFPHGTTGIIEADTKATNKGTFTKCSY